ncbi:MAG TPA: stage V sporulation protein S [Anaerolineae bacterium]|nr:stage V sporulation protein S [Anaerolineae bacterium]
MDIIKVAARSRTTAVAGAIAAVIRQSGYAEVQAIGASAVNQAVKAVAIARKYLTDDGIDLVCTPQFTEVIIKGETRTAIKLIVEPRPLQEPPAEPVEEALL